MHHVHVPSTFVGWGSYSVTKKNAGVIGPLIERSSCADVVRRYSRGLDAWGCSDRVRWVSSWASSAVLRPDGVPSLPVALSV